MTKCYMCEQGMLKKEKVPYTLLGELIGHFEAEVCTQCKEVFFSEEISKKITEVTKAKGLWGISARTKIGEAGNTLDVRLPKRIIELMDLEKGTEVLVYPVSKKKLIVEI
ncbi:hypothetical protein A2642_01765 [Candidatus Nomurabacteria bacterium RIFCSPHIGHO2_01_FULL_39_10]|uniref:SpoVT-AbrB domain-containing protein n=1 Tax=Candidatus Nomurabacteria bacterium RIFCSPHIGHO2_01_FULL_39_10 TaxID=1801733 RepID=A0A1F6V4V2_9BACT|nr:MAG: hypothetical protein A2642_01765 [Candidatus Nomurabacteria bacterium RIFCSPHIGHO2_01_FULL_39_10]